MRERERERERERALGLEGLSLSVQRKKFCTCGVKIWTLLSRLSGSPALLLAISTMCPSAVFATSRVTMGSWLSFGIGYIKVSFREME